MQQLQDSGFKPYIIGGAIRDALLGLEPKDWDIFCDATGQQILSLFPDGTVLGGQERQAKILTVIVNGVEISQFRRNGNRTQVGSSLREHQSTCDFTINSIALGLDGILLDPFNGIHDLQQSEFGFVGEPKDRISEDPLRIFRAVRFMSQLGFSFRHTGALKEYKNTILQLPKERLREEFLKIIKLTHGLDMLLYYGLLELLIPKWKSILGVEGGKHHDEKVDEHCVYAFNMAKTVSHNWKIWLAALLHDIGKGDTYSNDNGEIHFYEHERVGAEYVKQWMTDMKFATKEIDFIVCLIRNHMWDSRKGASDKSYIKHFNYFKDNGVHIMDFLLLTYSDNQGNQKNTRKHFEKYIRFCGLIEAYYRLKYQKMPFTIADLEIKGQDLLDMGMRQGRIIGETLQLVYDRVMDGVLDNNRPDLMNFVRGEIIHGN